LLLVVPETVLVLVRLIPAAQANKMQLSLKLPDPGRELYVEGAQI